MASSAIAESAFRAVADPTRRAILDLLADGERAVRDLCARFKLTQPAISQHLRVLRDAKLVRVRRLGRMRLYRLRAEPLKAVYDWTAHYERFWTERFRALGDVLDRLDERPTRN
jgi:DNA-binding transcriptional ArsR family regulator